MPAERPPWLDDEAEILALLGAALDRFDRQRGVDRTRRISLAALEYLPSLARADAEADQLWAFVDELERHGVLGIRKARRSPYDPEWQGAKLTFVPEVEETLRVWLRREWSEPATLIWRRAIERYAAAFHDSGAALLSQRIVIEDRSADEVVGALAGAARLTVPMTLRQLSATLFWGDSKVLDDRGELVAALLPHLGIRDRPIVIAAHLPAVCDGVLFVENQDTYTGAVAGFPIEARSLALVYAAGFRGSAARVRSRSGSLLHYARPARGDLVEYFDSWWYDGGEGMGPLWFWGDLDFAGMQILKALRGRFEGMQAWRPGYEPMLASVEAGGGYGAAADGERADVVPRAGGAGSGGGQGQLDPVSTGCEYADSVLLPAIRSHGRRDQEAMGR
jgi:hypothetical protein